MALPGPPEPPRGAPRKAPSLLEMGALCLDSEIILGFTSHLLRRRAKVRAERLDPRAAEALSRDFAASPPPRRMRRREGGSRPEQRPAGRARDPLPHFPR